MNLKTKKIMKVLVISIMLGFFIASALIFSERNEYSKTANPNCDSAVESQRYSDFKRQTYNDSCNVAYYAEYIDSLKISLYKYRKMNVYLRGVCDSLKIECSNRSVIDKWGLLQNPKSN